MRINMVCGLRRHRLSSPTGRRECLYNAFVQVILNPGDEVIIISPYWLTYPEQVKMAGACRYLCRQKEENDFEPALADLEKAVSERTRAIIVNNPSNPCGIFTAGTLLEEIAGFAKAHDLYIISMKSTMSSSMERGDFHCDAL